MNSLNLPGALKDARIIALRGYSNGNTDYQEAKKSAGGTWTDIPEGHIKKDGWAGTVIPEEKIVCDIDDPEYFARLHSKLKELGIKHVAIKTPNGGQFIFKDAGTVKTQSSGMMTVGGFICDYRLANKGYIVAPSVNTPGREVIHEDSELDPMPDMFIPVRRYNPDKDSEKLIPSIIPQGARDDTIFRHAGRVKEWNIAHHLGFTEDQREGILQMVNTIFCEPHLTPYEITQKLRSSERGAPLSESNDREEYIKPLRAVSITDFLQMEFPPRENIISPWLPSQGSGMIYAPRGTGKTYVVMGIAGAIASGGSFLGWEAPQARAVLYIDGEMAAVDVQERFSSVVLSADKEMVAPLIILTPDLQKNGMPDLTSTAGQAAIEPFLESVSLVIVDNLSTLCRNGRENEGESWLPVQDWALRLRARGISVLFVHHAGKGGAQRGTSRREDVLDTVIQLKRPGDYKPDEGARFEVHFEKSRGIYGDSVKPIEAQLTTDHEGRQTWKIKTLEQSLTERVADLLNDGIPQNEIAELLGVAKGTVSKHKNKAQALGLLS
jgi:hypothetical protein